VLVNHHAKVLSSSPDIITISIDPDKSKLKIRTPTSGAALRFEPR